MGRRRTGLVAFVVLAASVLAASPALAQGATPAAGAQPAPSKDASADPVERARVHYERGLQLFNEENYDAALFEFDRAYELAPSYKILYNMGRIQRQQHNYAAAIRSYSRYLREGGAGVPADRKTEVEREIAVLKPRVANVTVKVNVDGADVYADDIPVCTATIESACVGKSPLQAPIIVNGGRHKITATKPGYAPATSLVSVVGSDAIDVKLDLVSYAQPIAKPTNPWKVPMWIGWGVTAAGLITSGVTGYLATNARDDQEAAVGRLGASREELDQAKDKTRTLGNVTDGFLIGSAVAAGVSTYLTIRAVSWKGEARSVDVRTGLGNVSVVGRF
jgi:hypothetical protein